MQQIHYRPIEAKDYPTVGEIINQSFGLYRYVSEVELLELFKMQYVYSCLAEATYTCVAELDGKVVGVIMGQAKTAYRISQHLAYGVNALRCSLNMKRICHGVDTGMNDFKNLHKLYRHFSEKHKGEFDGVLTLFAVDQNCRGFGVGKTLLSGLLEYLRSQMVKQIYLYTDTTCNYGFYEHQGFQRLESQSMTLTKDGIPFQMDVFLFSYSLIT